MRHLIFASRAEWEARNSLALQQGQAVNLFAAGTTNYADVVQHPFKELFALPVTDEFSVLFTEGEMAATVDLADEWYFMGNIEGQFVIEESIAAHPTDPTITRFAFCNLPIVQEYLEKTFVLRVVIRHYRNGEHIYLEIPDKEVFLKADNADGEYDQFYAWIATGANIFDLTRQYIHVREYRFNDY